MKPFSNKVELNKMPGFDILEKLPEEQLLRSYNEEFYTTLSNAKIMSMPIIERDKLFYHFEQNDNAPISTTTGQLLATYEELCKSNETIKVSLYKLRKEIEQINEEISVVDRDIEIEYRPEIQRMKNNLQKVLVEQKTENFKQVKEIAILEKEKFELQNVVYTMLGKLHKLEREIGVKSKAYTYLFDQSIIDNEIGNKFIIDKEDI